MAQTTFTVDREKREMVMTRIFDAPRELVYKTYIDPTLLPQWWGITGTTTVDKMDVRPGGQWRYVQHDDSGNQYAFSGVYQEVVPPERLAYTFEFEAMPGHVLVETITFEEHDGKTKLTSTSVFETIEDLEGMLQSGAEQGAIVTWDRLAELLNALNARAKQA
jgi:uncharacterized protein YndB with AHSA1/START domain